MLKFPNSLRVIFYVNLFVLALALPVQANLVITPQMATQGKISVSANSFQDKTDARSAVQAGIQFQNMKGRYQPSTFLDPGTKGGNFWMDLDFTNNSTIEKWRLELPSLYPNLPSSIKSIAVYDPANPATPVAVWSQANQKSKGKLSLPLTLASVKTTTRYIYIETWPGIRNPVAPVLKTIEQVIQSNTGQAQKIGLLWLVMGAVCGAGFVQLILTRQAVQGMLALNALLLGGSVFLLTRPELVPGIVGYHPVMLPLAIAVVINTGASLMMWVASGRYTSRAYVNIFPIMLNIAGFLFVWSKLDMIIDADISVEKFPALLISATGLILLLNAVALGFAEIGLLWFLPAWIALAAMPWLAASHPFAAPILYAFLLCVSGIRSVFSHWKSMDHETEALQNRLRHELKNTKSQYEEENKSWERKMENERNLLNELRHREQQRSAELDIARKDADAANKAKSDFLAIISHEIRTPMTGIMGIVDLMGQTAMSHEQLEYVDIIKNSGDTMVTLLDDILDYSKIEKGAIDLESIPFALRVMVKSIATLMGGRAKEKSVQIIVETDEKLPDCFKGDPNRIRQILLNLVSNAIKFTHEGSVTIRVSADIIGDGRATLRFEVIDTGIGISQDTLTKLFQAYTQADSSISRRFGGTGLGLNICRMLVHAMNGEIGVKSAEGEGSTFWFTLPLPVESIAVERMAPDPDYAPTQVFHILLVDDNLVNLRVTKGLLEMDGHYVVTAESGQKALQLIEHESFDVIFVDLLMPDMDGKVFVTTLRQNPHPSRAGLPVFALTGLSDDETRQKVENLGLKDILVKPVSKKGLRKALALMAPRTQDRKEIFSFESLVSHISELSEEDQEKILRMLNRTDTRPVAIFEDNKTAPEDILNIGTLNDLKVSLPPATFNEIFAELIDKAKELVDALQQSHTKDQPGDIREKAHNLKGMAGNFGLRYLMSYADRLELLSRHNEMEKIAKVIDLGPSVLHKTVTALKQWIDAN